MLDAVAKRPALITQVGNQRMGPAGRQHAVDILRRGLLGKAVEAHVWISGPGDQGDGYFMVRRAQGSDAAARQPRLDPVARCRAGCALPRRPGPAAVAVELGLRNRAAGRLVHAPARRPVLRVRPARARGGRLAHAHAERLLPRAARALDADVPRDGRAVRAGTFRRALLRQEPGAVARRARASRGRLAGHRHAGGVRGRRAAGRARGEASSAGSAGSRSTGRRSPARARSSHATTGTHGSTASSGSRARSCSRRSRPAPGWPRPACSVAGPHASRGRNCVGTALRPPSRTTQRRIAPSCGASTGRDSNFRPWHERAVLAGGDTVCRCSGRFSV